MLLASQSLALGLTLSAALQLVECSGRVSLAFKWVKYVIAGAFSLSA